LLNRFVNPDQAVLQQETKMTSAESQPNLNSSAGSFSIKSIQKALMTPTISKGISTAGGLRDAV